MNYSLNEMFWSIQGEGAHAGKTSVFVRLQGCPVGCPWCDSKLTWYNGGEIFNQFEIANRVVDMPRSELIIITGGEPTIYNLDALIISIREQLPYTQIHLETSGSLPYKGAAWPDWITVSPKEMAKWHIDREILERANELKYVVDEAFEEGIVEMHLRAFFDYTNDKYYDIADHLPIVSLMPEGSPPRNKMVEKAIHMLHRNPDWKFSPRLQYAYPGIGKLEGKNNDIISAAQARSFARGKDR